MSSQSLFRIDPSPAFQQILKDDIRYSSGSVSSVGDSLNAWYDRLMAQSGVRSSPAVWLNFCLICGVALGGAGLLFTGQLLLTGILFSVGAFFPIALAMVARSRRQEKILNQLPTLADELARCVRSGRHLAASLKVVAATTPAPLGDEIKTVVRRTEMGIDLGTAINDLFSRTGVNALGIFVSAVRIHQDTGGDLISVLERTAAAARERLQFRQRLKAATITSRLVTIMMLVIPPCIFVFYAARDSNFLTQVFESHLGCLCLLLGVFLQFVGVVAVSLILRRSSRFSAYSVSR